MTNSIFEFKQFKVSHSNSTLKVTTEGCLLGAVAHCDSATNILDIGSGTGLLALMMAQRSDATITAVEVDSASAEESRKNFLNSPWKDRLTLMNQSIQEYADTADQFFDLIVSNPPFYQDHPKRSDDQLNKAMHDHIMPMDDLLYSTSRLLDDGGRIDVMYPEYQADLLLEKASIYSLSLMESIEVTNRPGGKVFRRILSFQKQDNVNVNYRKLSIRDYSGSYSSEFVDLLRPFYLHL